MSDTRRQFITTVAAGAAAVFFSPSASAQRRPPDAGIDYRVLERPLPTESAGKIEVVEFFWYGCPHCYAFEPALIAWIKRAPADVVVRRLPALFNPTWVQHARLYHALEALGEIERLHQKCFDAIHQDRIPMLQEAEMIEWAARNGVDRAKFANALQTASPADKLEAINRAIRGYGIDGVPAMGINGRYLTSPAIVGSHEACLQVTDYLVGLERRGRRA